MTSMRMMRVRRRDGSGVIDEEERHRWWEGLLLVSRRRIGCWGGFSHIVCRALVFHNQKHFQNQSILVMHRISEVSL